MTTNSTGRVPHPNKTRWLSSYRQAIAAGFTHFAAGIRAAYPLTFGEEWPEAERTPAQRVADYLRSKPEVSQ